MYTNIGISDLNGDVIICRYLTKCKFERLLEDSAIYLSNLDKLCDKKEGELGRIDSLFAKQTGQDCNKIDADVKSLKNHLFVNCWYVGDNEDASMWEKYAKADGVMIKSTVGSLKASFECACIGSYENGKIIKEDEKNIQYILNFRKEFGLVNYINCESSFIGSNIKEERCFHKSTEYAHEKEYRVVLYTEDFNSSIFKMSDFLTKNQAGINLKVCLKCLIKKIVLPPHANTQIVDKINSQITAAGLSNKEVIKSQILTD